MCNQKQRKQDLQKKFNRGGELKKKRKKNDNIERLYGIT